MSEIEPKDFKQALGRFASGVTVVTVRGEDGTDHGMTASAFSSVSLDPPLILVCIKNGNHTYELVEAAGSFAVNILAREQEALSNRFAGGIVGADGQWTPWPEDRDKFADLGIQRAETSGAALLDGAIAQLDCSLEAIQPGGDHGIFVGRIHGIRYADADASAPLIYCRGRYGDFA